MNKKHKSKKTFVPNRNNYYIKLEKEDWLIRPRMIYSTLKCKTDNCCKQATIICNHCRYGYCQTCYDTHNKGVTNNG